MNLKEIKEVIQLMNENQLSEFEMEKDGLKVRLKKSTGGGVEQVVYETRPVSAPSRSQGSTESKDAPKPQAAAKTTVKSPMVGTFYAAAAPDAPPLVQAGSEIQVGQVICIIEAMKLMNEIKAEVKGRVVELLVHNGDPVEFGQPLFVLE